MPNAFSKNIPSVFVITSPFQLINSREAIYELEIEDYHFVFALHKDAKRNTQMFATAKSLGIEYDLYYLEDIDKIDFENSEGLFSKKKDKLYERAFVGDFLQKELHMLASLYLENGSVLLNIDDGVSTYAYLRHIYKDKPLDWGQRIKWYKNGLCAQKIARKNLYRVMKSHGIICEDAFFTVFHDVRSHSIQLYPNKLTYCKKNMQLNKDDVQKIVIVGNYMARDASMNNISEIELEGIVWRKLKEVRMAYPSTIIEYYPHGNDQSVVIPKFCALLDIQYVPLKEPIEIHMMHESAPIAIFGVNSTALLNLKVLFPDTVVTEWFLDKEWGNQSYIYFSEISKYYASHDIDVDYICFPDVKVSDKVQRLLNNLESVVKLPFTKLHKKGKKYDSM